MSSLKHAILKKPGELTVEDIEATIGRLLPHDVRVAVEAVGICGSDLHIFRGDHPVLRPPIVLGHEFVGRVAAVGAAVDRLSVGDRVIALAGRGCGTCVRCRKGDWNLCRDLRVVGGHLPGGMAEEVILPYDQFVRIPDAWSMEDAVLVEPTAVAVHAVHRYGSVAGHCCLVLGAGPIGTLLARVLVAYGAERVVVSEVSVERIQAFPPINERVTVCNLENEETRIWLTSTYPDGFDVAFDCAGLPVTLHRSLELTRRGGAVVMVAVFPPTIALESVLVQRHERLLIGTQMYQTQDVYEVLSLLANGTLNVTGMVTHRFPLDSISEAFALAMNPDVVHGKVIVLPGS